jgi:hypothetical protein
LNGVIPNATAENIYTLTVGDTNVITQREISGITYEAIILSGYFYPNQQRFSEGSKLSDILKAMLVINMATVTTQPWNWYGGNTVSDTRIRSILNPNTNTDPGSAPIVKSFLSYEITHIRKRAIVITESMYSGLNVLIDAENKVNLMKAIYSNLLNSIRYTITFSFHNSTAGTSSLVIGDAITTPAADGLWYVTAISDEDENGLITITAAGGY